VLTEPASSPSAHGIIPRPTRDATQPAIPAPRSTRPAARHLCLCLQLLHRLGDKGPRLIISSPRNTSRASWSRARFGFEDVAMHPQRFEVPFVIYFILFSWLPPTPSSSRIGYHYHKKGMDRLIVIMVRNIKDSVCRESGVAFTILYLCFAFR
jgi:hypothetical protein